MDVVFADDQMRARTDHAGHNMALLKQLALNLLRTDPTARKGSLKTKRLIAATSEFFYTLVPAISYRVWAIIFSVMSFGMATMGLETVLAVAAPIIGFIYPPGITLILITLVEPLLRKRMYFYWGFRLPIWVAVIWSALTTFQDLGWGTGLVDPLVSWGPMQELGLGWILPTVAALVIGLIADLLKPRQAPEPVSFQVSSPAV